VRRKFFDVHAATASPIAKEAFDRVGQLYGVEETIKGLPPEHRRRERQPRSRPVAEALAAWADETARKLSRKSELAAAFRYRRGRRTALVCCFDDDRLALDNNPAERASCTTAAASTTRPPTARAPSNPQWRDLYAERRLEPVAALASPLARL
jgi:transposase